jgi:hypothetical protein
MERKELEGLGEFLHGRLGGELDYQAEYMIVLSGMNPTSKEGILAKITEYYGRMGFKPLKTLPSLFMREPEGRRVVGINHYPRIGGARVTFGTFD